MAEPQLSSQAAQRRPVSFSQSPDGPPIALPLPGAQGGRPGAPAAPAPERAQGGPGPGPTGGDGAPGAEDAGAAPAAPGGPAAVSPAPAQAPRAPAGASLFSGRRHNYFSATADEGLYQSLKERAGQLLPPRREKLDPMPVSAAKMSEEQYRAARMARLREICDVYANSVIHKYKHSTDSVAARLYSPKSLIDYYGDNPDACSDDPVSVSPDNLIKMLTVIKSCNRLTQGTGARDLLKSKLFSHAATNFSISFGRLGREISRALARAPVAEQQAVLSSLGVVPVSEEELVSGNIASEYGYLLFNPEECEVFRQELFAFRTELLGEFNKITEATVKRIVDKIAVYLTKLLISNDSTRRFPRIIFSMLCETLVEKAAIELKFVAIYAHFLYELLGSSYFHDALLASPLYLTEYSGRTREKIAGIKEDYYRVAHREMPKDMVREQEERYKGMFSVKVISEILLEACDDQFNSMTPFSSAFADDESLDLEMRAYRCELRKIYFKGLCAFLAECNAGTEHSPIPRVVSNAAMLERLDRLVNYNFRRALLWKHARAQAGLPVVDAVGVEAVVGPSAPRGDAPVWSPPPVVSYATSLDDLTPENVPVDIGAVTAMAAALLQSDTGVAERLRLYTFPEGFEIDYDVLEASLLVYKALGPVLFLRPAIIELKEQTDAVQRRLSSPTERSRCCEAFRAFGEAMKGQEVRAAVEKTCDQVFGSRAVSKLFFLSLPRDETLEEFSAFLAGPEAATGPEAVFRHLGVGGVVLGLVKLRGSVLTLYSDRLCLFSAGPQATVHPARQRCLVREIGYLIEEKFTGIKTSTTVAEYERLCRRAEEACAQMRTARDQRSQATSSALEALRRRKQGAQAEPRPRPLITNRFASLQESAEPAPEPAEAPARAPELTEEQVREILAGATDTDICTSARLAAGLDASYDGWEELLRRVYLQGLRAAGGDHRRLTPLYENQKQLRESLARLDVPLDYREVMLGILCGAVQRELEAQRKESPEAAEQLLRAAAALSGALIRKGALSYADLHCRLTKSPGRDAFALARATVVSLLDGGVGRSRASAEDEEEEERYEKLLRFIEPPAAGAGGRAEAPEEGVRGLVGFVDDLLELQRSGRDLEAARALLEGLGCGELLGRYVELYLRREATGESFSYATVVDFLAANSALIFGAGLLKTLVGFSFGIRDAALALREIREAAERGSCRLDMRALVELVTAQWRDACWAEDELARLWRMCVDVGFATEDEVRAWFSGLKGFGVAAKIRDNRGMLEWLCPQPE